MKKLQLRTTTPRSMSTNQISMEKVYVYSYRKRYVKNQTGNTNLGRSQISAGEHLKQKTPGVLDDSVEVGAPFDFYDRIYKR